jgi:hypothetical protein
MESFQLRNKKTFSNKRVRENEEIKLFISELQEWSERTTTKEVP